MLHVDNACCDGDEILVSLDSMTRTIMAQLYKNMLLAFTQHLLL